jgi:hypothetical protein
VNKEWVQDILLSGIIVKNQSMGRKKEVTVKKYDVFINEEEDYTTSEQVLF